MVNTQTKRESRGGAVFELKSVNKDKTLSNGLSKEFETAACCERNEATRCKDCTDDVDGHRFAKMKSGVKKITISTRTRRGLSRRSHRTQKIDEKKHMRKDFAHNNNVKFDIHDQSDIESDPSLSPLSDGDSEGTKL